MLALETIKEYGNGNLFLLFQIEMVWMWKVYYGWWVEWVK
jgi:hypothetical protein